MPDRQGFCNWNPARQVYQRHIIAGEFSAGLTPSHEPGRADLLVGLDAQQRVPSVVQTFSVVLGGILTLAIKER